MIKIMQKEYYKLGNKLGLTPEEIDDIIQNLPIQKEPASFDIGPPGYGGGRYGTISIKEFKK